MYIYIYIYTHIQTHIQIPIPTAKHIINDALVP